MQPLLEELIKNIVTSSLDLDVNIHILKSNITEKRLFNCVVSAIKCYSLVKLPKHAKSIFFWLARLSLLNGLPTNLNRTKIEVNSENGDISNGVNIGKKVNNKRPWADRLPFTNISPSTDFNYTKIESCNDH